MTPGEELAHEAARLERARFNQPLPRPSEPERDLQILQAARRQALIRAFNEHNARKAVS